LAPSTSEFDDPVLRRTWICRWRFDEHELADAELGQRGDVSRARVLKRDRDVKLTDVSPRPPA
jgi:hypothetical protein